MRVAEKRTSEFVEINFFLELEYITVNLHDLVLGSFAVALVALTQQTNVWSKDLQESVRGALVTFANYLHQKADGITFAGQVASVGDQNRLIIIILKAMTSIAESLSKLVNGGHIPANDKSQFGTLVHDLKVICDKESAFDDAKGILQSVILSPLVPQPPPRPPMQVAESKFNSTAKRPPSSRLFLRQDKRGAGAGDVEEVK